MKKTPAQRIRDYFKNDQNKESLANNLLNQRLFSYIDDFFIYNYCLGGYLENE